MTSNLALKLHELIVSAFVIELKT